MEKDQSGRLASAPGETLSEEQIIRLQAHLIELAHDAIIIRDSSSRILSWNHGAETTYGWSEGEVIGKVTHELFQTVFPISHEAVDLLLEQKGSWEGQLIHMSRDGSRRIVDSHQVLVKGMVGQLTAVLEVNRDITEQVLSQQAQAESQVTEMALRETTEQMSVFLSIISHELKTPITAVKGNIQLAKRQLARLLRGEPRLLEIFEGETNPALLLPTFLERAEHQIDVQSRLINDLVDVSRIANDQLTLLFEPCNLVEIVVQVVEEQRVLTPGRTIDWNCSLAQANILADADRVGLVVYNYLSNALKYTEIEQDVAVELKQEDGMVRVLVHDKGPGLSDEQQEHIWERFFRVEGIEVKSGAAIGLGLGLYICRNLIERQGGQVGVISEQGKGATFWFTLPLATS